MVVLARPWFMTVAVLFCASFTTLTNVRPFWMVPWVMMLEVDPSEW